MFPLKMRLKKPWRASMEVTPGRRECRRQHGKRCQMVAILAMTIVLLSIVLLFGLADVLLKPRMTFSIILDAGSTGTRMTVYSFGRKSAVFELKNSTYDQIEPGLSSYADNPREGALSLKPLLNKALTYVPESEYSSTTISLKATAGLRSLTPAKQLRLLHEVRKLMEEYPFVVNDRSVEVLDGELEGFYSWVTVAFLQRKDMISNDVAALDLGGRSTQVSIVPDEDTIAKKPEHVHYMNGIGGKTVRIYSHSYTGAGLMSAREKILKWVRKGNSSTPDRPCIRSNPTGEQNSDTVGPSDFEKCHDAVRDFIAHLGMFRLKELQNREVYLMSYFFDLAVEAGLILETDGVKRLRVEDYLQKATKECGKAVDVNVDNVKSLCLDLTFVYSLLSDGLGMDDTSEIQVIRTIYGTDVSWTLGAALCNLQL